MERFGIIYKVTNKVNEKVYVGQTIRSLSKRRAQHLYDSKTDKVNNSLFLKALRKYEEKDFLWEKIYKCYSRKELNDKEVFYINFYKSNDLNSGYNLVIGKGKSGYKVSDETKRKISKKATKRLSIPENNPMYGKKHTEQTKKLISSARKGKFAKENNPFYGKKHINESKSKMSISRSGKNNHFYGKNLTKEHRNKISDALKGRKFSDTHKENLSKGKKGKYLGKENKSSKKYIITTPDNDELVIHGLADFCRKNGLNQSHMSSCVTGNRNHHKGFKCRIYREEL